jgi:hypothetical protein
MHCFWLYFGLNLDINGVLLRHTQLFYIVRIVFYKIDEFVFENRVESVGKQEPQSIYRMYYWLNVYLVSM